VRESAKPSIFTFDDPVEYLKVRTSRGSDAERKTQHSLAVWARRLGYRSARSLGMILNGTRLPSPKMVERLSRLLALDEREHRYFQLLLEERRALAEHRSTDAIVRALVELRGRRSAAQVIEARAFAVIADWHHLVIRQLLRSTSWSGGMEAISRRLHGRVSGVDVRLAIKRLADLGLVVRRKGRFVATDVALHTKAVAPNAAYRIHHKQMLERAAEAIDQVDPSRRDLSTTTLLVDPARMAEAKDAIRAFREDFIARFECISSKEVYQIAVQFFPHTAPAEAPVDAAEPGTH
jgi:uncharacterized protein (TIGR02147 family)